MPVKVYLSRYGPHGSIIAAKYPYAPDVTAIVREVPGREYRPAYKLWTFPATWENVMLLRDRLAAAGHGLEIPAELRKQLNDEWRAHQDAAAIRSAGDAEVDFEFLTEPYAHQRAGLAFLTRLGSGALFWEMGLGKTKTAIDYAEWLARSGELEEYQQAALGLRVLVVCPNTVKRNWGAEIAKHAGHEDYVIPKGTMVKRAEQLATARYTIVNVEALSLDPLRKAIVERDWDLVIVDESTRFKTPKAARTKALHKLKKRAARRVILTGTPITGKPEDAWSQLEFVRPGIFGSSFWAFGDRYLQKDWFGNVVGIKPGMADELKTRIDSVGYRILKEQVLDLPPKVYSDRRVTMDGEQLRAYRQMRDELRIEIEGMEVARAANILTLLLRLTQVTAGLVGGDGVYEWLAEKSAKVRELDDLLLDELRGEQVVIYGLYQRELEELAARYAPGVTLGSVDGGRFQPHHNKQLPPVIYGPTPEQARHEFVEAFQRGDLQRLFVQTRTGGIGINLTAARVAIYHTRGWGLEEYLQSQDRLHRIGQTGTVSIVHLVAEESIDQEIADALNEKQSVADHLTGDAARRLAARILER